MGIHWNVGEVNVGEFFDTCGGFFYHGKCLTYQDWKSNDV